MDVTRVPPFVEPTAPDDSSGPSDWLFDIAQRDPDRIFIETPAGEQLGYRTFAQTTAGFAAALQTLDSMKPPCAPDSRNGSQKFKLPKRVLFVAELPRNSMGKVQKNALREQYRDPYQSSQS